MASTTVSIPTRVLVLGMAAEDGAIRAEEVYDVAEACGQTAEQVRSCLRRLVAEGTFTREGSGRGARYVPTELGSATMLSGLERMRLSYVQDAAGRGWDGRWHLVAFAVPEARRTARDGFRDRLLALGGAAIQGGLYVSPHRWSDEVRDVAKSLGVDEQVTLAETDRLEVGGVRDPRELAAQLWPLARVADGYRRFVEDHERVPAALDALKRRHGRLADAEYLPLALRMAVAYSEVAAHDPYLPPELLPRPWPGRAARDIVVRSRRLALQLREDAGRPGLFGLFDAAVLEQLT